MAQICYVPTQKKTPYTTAKLISLTGIPKRTFVWVMNELKACGIVIVEGKKS
ncbi:MAG: hypothetical protein M0T74_06420 [Desulfitobacterium hafniense]|uniref:hypothetical protein n=1 Tax=Desulfosporosinus sp. TaxID=157907 RepID=UPI002327D4C9|nr:hypothetical protein [Desulfosporosinus sp.]MCO5387571.1 hypothetical protein [Desulfosporosinus sp.]MDA8227330.1 hypothetical protein [Desulfitobacterium hafniense]